MFAGFNLSLHNAHDTFNVKAFAIITYFNCYVVVVMGEIKGQSLFLWDWIKLSQSIENQEHLSS
jgi:hypothetical protein